MLQRRRFPGIDQTHSDAFDHGNSSAIRTQHDSPLLHQVRGLENVSNTCTIDSQSCSPWKAFSGETPGFAPPHPDLNAGRKFCHPCVLDEASGKIPWFRVCVWFLEIGSLSSMSQLFRVMGPGSCPDGVMGRPGFGQPIILTVAHVESLGKLYSMNDSYGWRP